MTYNELIELMEIGHEFIGETSDGLYFGVLNIEEDVCNILIGKGESRIRYKIPYGEIYETLESMTIYKNKTYKELLDNEDILIYEMY